MGSSQFISTLNHILFNVYWFYKYFPLICYYLTYNHGINAILRLFIFIITFFAYIDIHFHLFYLEHEQLSIAHRFDLN